MDVCPRTLCTMKLGVDSGGVADSARVSRPGRGGCGGKVESCDAEEMRRNLISETDIGMLSAGDTGKRGWATVSGFSLASCMCRGICWVDIEMHRGRTWPSGWCGEGGNDTGYGKLPVNTERGAPNDVFLESSVVLLHLDCRYG